MEIKETTNYDIFSSIKGNRHVDLSVVKKKKEMLQRQNLMRQFPIVVNTHYQIIDGQHRFCALKEMRLPVPYVVTQELGIQDIININNNVQKWSMRDYLESYCESGNINYINFSKAISDLSVSPNIGLVLHGFKKNNRPHDSFRQGKFIFNPVDQMILYRRYRVYALVNKYFVGAKSKMVHAMLLAIEKYGATEDQMETKLQMVPESYIKNGNTLKDCLRILEDVYNFRNEKKNHLRFY